MIHGIYTIYLIYMIHGIYMIYLIYMIHGIYTRCMFDLHDLDQDLSDVRVVTPEGTNAPS